MFGGWFGGFPCDRCFGYHSVVAGENHNTKLNLRTEFCKKKNHHHDGKGWLEKGILNPCYVFKYEVGEGKMLLLQLAAGEDSETERIVSAWRR